MVGGGGCWNFPKFVTSYLNVYINVYLKLRAV